MLLVDLPFFNIASSFQPLRTFEEITTYVASVCQAVGLQLCCQLMVVFPSSDETYDGGHISFSTNISALIKQFIILEVSDCERHTPARHEASLSLSRHVIRPVKPQPRLAEVLQGREVLPAGLK